MARRSRCAVPGEHKARGRRLAPTELPEPRRRTSFAASPPRHNHRQIGSPKSAPESPTQLLQCRADATDNRYLRPGSEKRFGRACWSSIARYVPGKRVAAIGIPFLRSCSWRGSERRNGGSYLNLSVSRSGHQTSSEHPRFDTVAHRFNQLERLPRHERRDDVG